MTIDKLKAECRYCYREIDASGLEAFRCTNKFVNKITSWCRPKNANEPCSMCEYCKPREETKMTIDDCIKELLFNKEDDTYVLTEETTDFIIDTMRKYQKLEQEPCDTCRHYENGCHWLPSVTLQEPKMGEWIKQNDDYFDWYECSECGYGSEGEMQYSSEYDVRTNYCPCCGAKMESEDN